MKVVVDAGHGGADSGAVYEGRKEKDDNLKLALAVGELLKKSGVDVVYTRTEDIYQKPIEKAEIANESGADYFISFHRNSSPYPNQYTGVETLVFEDAGKKAEMGRAINRELEQVGYKDLGINERPGLIVLRRTRMPALLVETGFINTEEDNQLFDEKFDEVAQGIADGILSVISGTGPRKLYRVQTGAYKQREYAQEQLYQLVKEGYPAFILKEDGFFKVQVGAYRLLENAIRMEEKLRKAGYSTYITT